MSNALMRRRTLDPITVKMATEWWENRIKELRKKGSRGKATIEERRELIWKWGIR